MSEKSKLPPALQAAVDEQVIDGLKKLLAEDLIVRMVVRQQIADVCNGKPGAFEWLMRDGNWQWGAAYYRYIEEGKKVP